ncbi:MAG: hypothetical protein AB7H80_10665 [Candidatus Kapaibacterium sp.]
MSAHPAQPPLQGGEVKEHSTGDPWDAAFGFPHGHSAMLPSGAVR